MPVGTATTQRAGDLDPFGRPDSLLFSQTVLATAQLIRGATAFKPQERELHLTLAVNLNYASAGERRILSVRPTDATTRFDGFFGVQEAFVEQHLRDVSDRYDFAGFCFRISSRASACSAIATATGCSTISPRSDGWTRTPTPA